MDSLCRRPYPSFGFPITITHPYFMALQVLNKTLVMLILRNPRELVANNGPSEASLIILINLDLKILKDAHADSRVKIQSLKSVVEERTLDINFYFVRLDFNTP